MPVQTAEPNISTWQALRDDENLLDNEEAEKLFARDTTPFVSNEMPTINLGH
jgi:hypothetical protein